MNMTQPPFDDVHVRKAMNWIIDKAALRQAWGGADGRRRSRTTSSRTRCSANQLADYKPYATPGDHGSVSKAKAAMKGSKYATSRTACASPRQCKNVLLIADARAVDPEMVTVIQQDAAKIGITFTVRTISGAYPTIQTPAKNVPIAERPGWGKDYADALTFFTPLFDGRTIIPNGNTNYSLVGITPSQCKTLKVTGDCTNVPERQLAARQVLDPDGPPRTPCYENLDKKLTTKVVPWVPWLQGNSVHITSSNVTHWQFDQFPNAPAYENLARQVVTA